MNLNVISVAEPCTVDWASMSGDQRVRHCELCRKNVYDLSKLSRTAAEDLIQQHDGNLCVRFYRRADGTVATADCTPLRQRLAQAAARTRRRARAALVATLAVACLPLSGFAAVDLHQRCVATLSELIYDRWLKVAPPKPLVAKPVYLAQTMGMIAPIYTRPATQPSDHSPRKTPTPTKSTAHRATKGSPAAKPSRIESAMP